MYQLLTNDTYQGVERILNFYDPFRLLNDGLYYIAFLSVPLTFKKEDNLFISFNDQFTFQWKSICSHFEWNSQHSDLIHF